MNAWLGQFHFLQPAWLLALFALPLLLWFGLRGDEAKRSLAPLADAELLPHLLHGRPRSRRASSALLLLGWTLAALALAGPTWNRMAQPLFAERPAQVVAISLSQRMLATDVTPSRIARARYKAHDLLQANSDGLNALIGYAGESFVVAPLTSDAHSLDELLDAMAPDIMPVDGDNAAQAIAQGTKLILDAKADGGSLVLIASTVDAAARVAARKARAEGVRVSVLGVGTPQGGPVALPGGGFLHDAQGNLLLARRDDAALAAVAQAGGGIYVPMRDGDGDVAALHRELAAVGHAATATGRYGDAWQDRGPWLLLPLLLVMALGFRRGWLLLLPLAVLPLLWPVPAHASTWRDWWQRPDQQASAALRAGHPQQAERLARDPALRGAAAYRAGDYLAAVQALEQAHGANAVYNLGNALARLGRYPQAIAAYDRALKLDPHDDDARFNRAAVEAAMKHRPKPPPSSSSSQPKNGKHGQGKQSGAADASKPDRQGQDKQAGSSAQSQQNGQRQNQQGQNQQGQNQQGQDRQDQNRQGQHRPGDASHSSHQDQSGQHPHDGKNRQSSSARNGAPPLQTAQQRAAQQAQTAKAQQALGRQLDQALGKPTNQAAPVHELGAPVVGNPLSKLPADLREALQAVPDDPGALLRRKFELEYLERQQRAQSEDRSP